MKLSSMFYLPNWTPAISFSYQFENFGKKNTHSDVMIYVNRFKSIIRGRIHTRSNEICKNVTLLHNSCNEIMTNFNEFIYNNNLFIDFSRPHKYCFLTNHLNLNI